MKPKSLNLFILCGILLLNIVFTQKMIHQYYYENYTQTLIYMSLNIVLFPIALYIYKRDRKKGGERA